MTAYRASNKCNINLGGIRSVDCFQRKRKNLVIFDWDDTLFPTTAFRTRQHRKDKNFMYKLQILVSYIEQIFTQMIKYYGAQNIIIVTNASENWIHKCLNVDIVQSAFAEFQNILKRNNIRTISAATSDIIQKFPKNHYKWKEVVFEKYFQTYFDSHVSLNCITSIGDSFCEYKACDSASKYLSNRILNRIKCVGDPSIDDMCFQLQHMCGMTDAFGCNIEEIELDYSSLLRLQKYCSETADTTDAMDTTDN